jgi:beta-lactamase regulating signal transducer with metallopeptidase domain
MIAPTGFETELGRYLAHSLWQGLVLLLAYLGLRRWLTDARAEMSCRAAELGVILLVLLPVLTALTALAATGTSLPVPAATADVRVLVPVPGEFLRLLQRHLTMDLARSLVFVWVAGVLVSLGHVLAGVWRLNRLLERTAQPVSAPALGDLAARVGLRRSPEIREWSGATAPFVAGWFQSIVVLPTGLRQQLSAGELEAVLLHELAHVKRNDVWTNLLLRLLGAFAWHQLALWKLMTDVARDREHCCDELAVAAMGKRLPLAQALLTLEERRAGQPRLVMAGTGGDFTARVRRIVAGEAVRSAGWVWRRATAGLTSLLVVTGSTLLLAASAEGQLEIWANSVHALVQASDPAGPFTVELMGRRLVGATIDGVPVPADRIVQRGEQVQMLDAEGRPELTLEVRAPGTIKWSPRLPRSP